MIEMKDWIKIIEEIYEVRYEICNEWELGFITDNYKKSQRPGYCTTETQEKVLKELYDKACQSDF